MPETSRAPVLDLPDRYFRIMEGLLQQYAPTAEVWVCGSRVDGSAHAGSDLDLVLRNPSDLQKPIENLNALKRAVQESDIPIMVDILDWAGMPESFRQRVEAFYWVWEAPVSE